LLRVICWKSTCYSTALVEKGIKISMGELTNLTRTFESLLKGWHDERIQEIREKLGKYVLSIDGTYSYKDETLYIFRSYEQGLILYAATAEKDDTAHFQPLLEKVLEMYGAPMAVISDMQPAIIEAVKNVIPGVPHQYCQFHFIRNAGKFMDGDYKALGTEIKKKRVQSQVKNIQEKLKEAEKEDSKSAVLEQVEEEVKSQMKAIEKKLEETEEGDCGGAVLDTAEEEILSQVVVKGKDLKKAEESDSREAVPNTAEEVQSKTKEVKGELRKEEKFKDCLLIIHILILLLKITVDNFPFGLYYVDLYDRYAKIRRTIRHCLAVYPHNDAYKKALLELDRVLTSVIEDKQIKSLVNVLKGDYKIFGKLREILENRDKKPREVVKGKMKHFLRSMEKKAMKEKKYTPLVSQINQFWCGLFHTYDCNYIPRTNNSMEQFIGRLRRKWKRITGCSKMNEWILYRAPLGIYMFNLIGKNAPLEILGFDTDLAKMLSSVSYETYKKCMDEYEMRKEDDRIRKRGNHDLDSVLEKIERMNKVLSSIGSDV
jgi:hypothetical protein